MTRIPTLLALGLVLAFTPLSQAAPEVRTHTVCHTPVPGSTGCGTATLTGTLVGCVGTTCQADFTLEVVVDTLGYCGISGTYATATYAYDCHGIPYHQTSSGSVTFTQGDSIVVEGLLCVGTIVNTQDCILFEDTFTF